MNRPKAHIWLRIALFVPTLVLLRHEATYGQEPAQIYAWVACQMDIADAGPPPVVRFVDKTELQGAFIRGNRNSYLRWEARFGAHQAETIMSVYLQEIVGMFDPRTELIYVGRFLEACRQEAILAHEITHYFQNRRYGIINPDEPGAEHIQIEREMEACTIEKRYSELFCKNQKVPFLTGR